MSARHHAEKYETDWELLPRVASAAFANPWHDEIGRFAPKGTGTRSPDIEGLVKFKSGDNVAYADPNRKGPGRRWAEVLDEEVVLFGHDRPEHLDGPGPEARQIAMSPHDGTDQGITDAVNILLDRPPKVDELRSRPLVWKETKPGVHFAEHWDGWRAAYDRDAMPPETDARFQELFGDAKFGWQRHVNNYMVKDAGKTLSGTARSLEQAKTKAATAGQKAIDDAVAKSNERGRKLRDEGRLTTQAFANPWHDEIGRFAPKGTGRRVVSRRVPTGKSAEWRLDSLQRVLDNDALEAETAAMADNLRSLHDGDETSLALFQELADARKGGPYNRKTMMNDPDRPRMEEIAERIYNHLTREVAPGEPLVEGFREITPRGIESSRTLWTQMQDDGSGNNRYTYMVEGVDAHGRARPIFLRSHGEYMAMPLQDRVDLLNGLADAHDAAPIPHRRSPLVIDIPQTWVRGENTMGMVMVDNPTTIEINKAEHLWDQAKRDVRANDHHWMPSITNDNLYQYIAAHEYGHVRMGTGTDHRHAILDVALNLPDDVEASLSGYGRTASVESHAEAFADWVVTNGASTNPATRAFAEALGWGQDAHEVALAAAGGRPTDDIFDGLIGVADGPDGPTYYYQDGTIVHIPVDQVVASAAQFANPWHDEIGRFAPKGTGRKFGATREEMRSLFEPVRPLVDVLEGAGAKTYLVGGSVRDRLRGIDAKDIDIEVHGMTPDETIELLKEQGARVDEVGASFGVLKVTFNGETHDFSFPRTEVKTGEGHTGFDVTVDPNLGIDKALERRDFTMNALAVDSDGNMIDPFGGVEDLRNGVLRHVGPAFSEDPLRILRGVQFASRLNLTFDPATAKLAHDLLPELEAMHSDRVWGEFAKLGGQGVSMEAGVRALRDVGLDTRYGNVHFDTEPDLTGLSGDQRAAVALTSIGVDPKAIGAPHTVSRAMSDIDKALAFTGDPAESRTLARELKYASFADAARITGPNTNVDPRVLDGPLPPLVSGNDVMARGVTGPSIGEVLRAVQRAQDNETITTRAEALAWLDSNAQANVRRSAAFANPWHDEIGRFAPKGTGTMHPLVQQMADWETTKPWNLTKDEAIAQTVPGFWHKTGRGTEAASWDGRYIRTTDEFYALPEETRRAVAYHEAGHAMLEAAGGLTTIDDPLGLVDKPGGQALSYNAEEILAEAYSVLWSEPEWFDRMDAHEIRDITIETALRAGFPLPEGTGTKSTGEGPGWLSWPEPGKASKVPGFKPQKKRKKKDGRLKHTVEGVEFANPWHDEIGQFAPKGTGKKSAGRASKAEEAAAKKLAREKARKVPKPSEDDVIQGQVDALLAREGLVRAGGDRRGNNTARKKRAKALVQEFGDGETCPCVDCGQRLAADSATADKLGIDALTQDKILVGTLGGSYKLENLIPACPPCNQSRGDREGVGVVGDVHQSWGSAERLTRQVVRENGEAIATRFQARRSAILKRKGISWEEHVAANPDALPQDFDRLRRPVGGNFTIDGAEWLDRRFVNGDTVHHVLGVDDPVRVDVPRQQFSLNGDVVNGVVEIVGGVPPEALGADHRAVLDNHRPKRTQFANPWHDEIGRFAPKGTGRKYDSSDPTDMLYDVSTPEGMNAALDAMEASVADKVQVDIASGVGGAWAAKWRADHGQKLSKDDEYLLGLITQDPKSMRKFRKAMKENLSEYQPASAETQEALRAAAEHESTNDRFTGMVARYGAIPTIAVQSLGGLTQGRYLAHAIGISESASLTTSNPLSIGVSFNVDSSLSGTFRHEYGHHVKTRLSTEQLDEFNAAVREWGGANLGRDGLESAYRIGEDQDGRGISLYSRMNNEEAFAETFAMVTHRDFDPDADYGPARPVIDFMRKLVEQ